MKLGVVNEETWDFLGDLYEDLRQHHDTSVFRRREIESPVMNTRINRFLLQRDLGRFLRANDVVFFEWASHLLAAASKLPKTCGIVVRLHRYEMYQWADRIQWDAVDRIILVSESKRREFAARFPGQAGKVSVVTEAVNLDRFQPVDKPFGADIGILCHLTPRKRVYELILAFSELLETRKDARLHIGGGEHPAYGDYYQAIRGVVRELGIEDRVVFYGHVSDTHEWFRNIDVFVSNSYSEGLQVAPMEAMASGRYCLSHRWDGADELLPPEQLFFTDRELAGKIAAFCDLSAAERQRAQAAMRSRAAELFNVERQKVQLRSLLEEVRTSRAMGLAKAPAPHPQTS